MEMKCEDMIWKDKDILSTDFKLQSQVKMLGPNLIKLLETKL